MSYFWDSLSASRSPGFFGASGKPTYRGGKVALDPGEAAHLVEEAKEGKLTADGLIARISQAVLRADELRILRALVDEANGRHLSYYRSAYGDAMKSLKDSGYIDDDGKRLRPTPEGEKLIAGRLLPIIQRYLGGTL